MEKVTTEVETRSLGEQCIQANGQSNFLTEIQTFSQVSLYADISKAPAVANYLRAIGTQESCLALYKVNTSLIRMAKQFQESRPLPVAIEWTQAFTGVNMRIAEIRKDETRGKDIAALYSPLPDSAFDGMYRTLLFAFDLDASPLYRPQLDQLTSAIVICAASHNMVINEILANGLRQCYRSLEIGPKSKWYAITCAATTECEGLQKLINPANRGVVNQFLQECITLLSLELKAPATLSLPPQGIDAGTTTTTQSDVPEKNGTSLKTENTQTEKAGETNQEVVAPSIASMVRAAQIAPFATKAGITHQWDFLHPADLAIVTRKLANLVFHENTEISAMATLAIASLELRANAKSALLTPTQFEIKEQRGDLWLDIERGCKSWPHAAYTSISRAEAKADLEHIGATNDIPLSCVLHTGLKRHSLDVDAPRTLKDCLKDSFDGAAIQLKKYNEFLRDAGDQAHVAEPSRFGHSLGATFLQITGSDMLAALCALNFEVAAPSALFYFSPTSKRVHEMCDQVFKYLGLGGATLLADASARLGAHP